MRAQGSEKARGTYRQAAPESMAVVGCEVMMLRCSISVLMLLAAGASAAVDEDEQAVWQAARGAVSAEPIWRYLDRFPKGLYTERARQRLAVLGAAPGRRFDG